MALALVAPVAACSRAPAPTGPAPAPFTDTLTAVATAASDTLVPVAAFDSILPGISRVRWRLLPGRDARQLMGDSLPVVTRSRVAVAFARRTTLAVTALPWDETWVAIASPPPPGPLGDSASRARFIGDLASEVAPVEARPAEPPYPWPSALPCDSSIARAPVPRSRIGYPAGDSTAGAIAERLAALSGSATVEALDSRELGWALSDGRDLAIVLPLSRIDPTLPIAACGSMVIPLVDSRPVLVRPTTR